MFDRIRLGGTPGGIEALAGKLRETETIVVGAGAGMSTAAGYTYSGERFERYFSDFEARYDFHDMYAGGFFPFETPERMWAYWSRFIYINRYMDTPKDTYRRLFSLVAPKEYFVLTTNVDHMFQKSGFDKARLFYTQGDYGLFQCSVPCHESTWDNADAVREMVLAQGFEIASDGALVPPADGRLRMDVPSGLVPRCPVCGEPASMNLRSDSTFVEDAGWHEAAGRYSDFLKRRRDSKTLFLELGVGFNTPGIVKYPFWQRTLAWPDATFATLNFGEVAIPPELDGRAIGIDGDIDATLRLLEQELA
jgi:NAD-dependent SIR2 family protein deacetylase